MDEAAQSHPPVAPSQPNAPPGPSISLAGKLFGMKDTKEVLIALQEVDSQLEVVDKWLGEQIDRLSEIQSNLHMIEVPSPPLSSFSRAGCNRGLYRMSLARWRRPGRT